MKLNYLVLSATAILGFSSVSGLLLNQSSAHADTMMKKSGGSFVAAEHPTKGTARIVTENGKRYLEFDRAFKSDQGPDLYVILHRAAAVPKGGLKEQDYVTLSRLQKVSGAQRYAIPKNLDLANYRSVAIWCRMFNATFGYAPLASSAQAAR